MYADISYPTSICDVAPCTLEGLNNTSILPNCNVLTGRERVSIMYIDWPDWAERLQATNPTEAAMLSFTADRTNYKVGDEATLTIPTMSDGRALISIENGSKILSTTWIDTKKGQTRYTFKIDGTMAPNIFVNVTLLQRHSQTVNDLPIRMYGVIPLTVDDPATILKPVISMPDKIKPETQSSVTVSEASGKEMTRKSSDNNK